MSNDKDKKQAPQSETNKAVNKEQSAESSVEAPRSEEETAADQSKTDTPEETADPTVTLSKENAELKDKLIRTLADMENLRARTEREKTDMAKYAIANFARDILTIGDNLGRAIAAVPEESIEADPTLKTLVEGVEMTERELGNTLERYGVKRIECKGEPFDPNLHQAMFEIPNPDITAGMIVEIVQQGYMIGDRILRPAGVGVSKGGAKRPKEEPVDTSKEEKLASSEKNAAEKNPASEKTGESSEQSIGSRIDKSA